MSKDYTRGNPDTSGSFFMTKGIWILIFLESPKVYRRVESAKMTFYYIRYDWENYYKW